MDQLQKFVSLVLALACTTALVGLHPSLRDDETDVQSNLERHAWQDSWAGNALQHTPFQHGLTTRFLLLKTCPKFKGLTEFLELSPDQLEKINELDALDDTSRPLKFKLGDLFDEEIIDPNYYSFLSDKQMNRLDALAFQLDGFSSILRESIKSNLRLSDETSKQAASLFADMRKSFVVPRGRRNFAAQLPADIKYQNVWWDASTATYLNMKILYVLNDDEKNRLSKFLTENSPSDDLVHELLTICEMPNGVLSLGNYAELDE